MATFTLPAAAQNYPWFEFTCVLDEARYTFTMAYNNRMDRWFLDIGDANGTTLAAGIPMLLQRSLTAQFPTLGLPPGTLFVVDTSGNAAQPGLAAFLVDHDLAYISIA